MKGNFRTGPPGREALSQGETDVSFLASKRELQSGFGMAECGKELSFVDKMLSSEYILWKFPCYTSKEKKEGCSARWNMCSAEKTVTRIIWREP